MQGCEVIAQIFSKRQDRSYGVEMDEKIFKK